MKNDLLKRFRRALKAFMNEDTPVPPPLPPEPVPATKEGPRPLTMGEIMDSLDKMIGKNGAPMNPMELYNMKAQASEIAKKAHFDQNTQINSYTDRILEKNIDPMILELYKDSNSVIPGLETNISMFVDPLGTNFGRRIMIRLQGKVIGDAIFTASFTNGLTRLSVDERIKV